MGAGKSARKARSERRDANWTTGMGGYYKMPDGTRIQVVGIAEDEKYTGITKDPLPVMFLSILQSPSSRTWLVVRSNRDPQQLGKSHKEHHSGNWTGCLFTSKRGTRNWTHLCLVRVWRPFPPSQAFEPHSPRVHFRTDEFY
jgi:hypothetical protein